MTNLTSVSLAIIALALVPPAHAQQTRTTCYDSGSTRICETRDGMGNIVSKSRCYQSGRDVRCDNQSINGTQPLPVPGVQQGDRPQR